MKIFTDASGANVSGVAFVITDDEYNVILERTMPIVGYDSDSAELYAILFALQELSYMKKEERKKEDSITIISDSKDALRCLVGGECRKVDITTLLKIYYYLEKIGLECEVEWRKGHRNDGTKDSDFNRKVDNISRKVRKDYSAFRQRNIGEILIIEQERKPREKKVENQKKQSDETILNQIEHYQGVVEYYRELQKTALTEEDRKFFKSQEEMFSGAILRREQKTASQAPDEQQTKKSGPDK